MDPVYVEALKVGTFKDSKGNAHTFTLEDLKSIAAGYNPAASEAPVVIGHPSDNAPAFGWIKDAVVKGQSLFLGMKDLVPEFVDACKKGMYKKRSISLREDKSIRHLGFLGAIPPAIKGLVDFAFAEGKSNTFDFDADASVEFKAGNFNEPLNEGEFMELKEALEQIGTLKAEKIALDGQIKTLTGKVTDFSEGDKTKTARIATLETELATVKKTLADGAVATRKAEFVSFCEKLVDAGKMSPKNKDTAISQLEIAFQASTGNFAEGQKKPIDELKAMLESQAVVIEFAEAATKAKAKGTETDMADPKVIANKATAYRTEQASAGNDISFSEAVAHVTKK